MESNTTNSDDYSVLFMIQNEKLLKHAYTDFNG